jgi:condensation domain-containing protein
MRELLAAMREPGRREPAVLRPAGHRTVTFRGERGGDGPQATGQRNTLMWVHDPAAYPRMVDWALDLPDSAALADIEAAFAVLMARHESLRTTYPEGTAVQRVARSGELAIALYEVDGGQAGRDELTTALVSRLRATEFDLARDLPVRAAVAVRREVPLAAVVVCSHMAADLGAVAVIGREFTELAGDPASRHAGGARHQPLDQAEAERSPRAARFAAAALRNWEAQLATVPQCLYPVPAVPPGSGGPPMAGWLWSEAAARALPHIAARTGGSPQAAVLAAVCAVLSTRTGYPRCTLATLMHNRYSQHLRAYVGTLACDTILSVDTAATGFDDLVWRAATATIKAAKGGWAVGPELERLTREVEDRRGICGIRDCVYNDISYVDAEPPSGAGDPGDAARALARTELRWIQPTQASQLLTLILGQVESELILGAATADPGRVPRRDLEMLLRGVERLLVAAAPGDVRRDRVAEITGITPLQHGPGWLRAGPSWVELSQVRRLVAGALRGQPACVATEPGPGDGELVAYLAAGEQVHTPEQAHAACMARLRDPGPAGWYYTAVAPARYVICAAPPGDPADPAAWRAQPVLAAGTGRAPLPRLRTRL